MTYFVVPPLLLLLLMRRPNAVGRQTPMVVASKLESAAASPGSRVGGD
jgi:hypothetical protein